jgi:site-specific DNA-methyltransferase (cytosine-N4-specific)
MNKMNKRVEDFTWDFIGHDTKEYTHCFHKYPAMMIPQIARRLISDNNLDAKLIFDPYCGTGTSLVEGKLVGIECIGTDLNPLARLISKVKTTIIENVELINEFNKLKSHLNSTDDVLIPKMINIDYWFKPKTIKELGKIKYYISNVIKNDDIKDFFNVCFSETIREVSLTRNSEFKMYRIELEKIEKHDPNTFEILFKKINRNILALEDFSKSIKVDKPSKVYDFNTSDTIEPIKDRKVDLIVTSPPYGDSKTTVAYGQFSRLSNEWLGIDNANQIDNILMGGKTRKEIYKTGVQSIDSIVDEISKIDKKRAGDVLSFLDEYKKSIENVSSIVTSGGIVCYVVGNRRVKDIYIELDNITTDLFCLNGFNHEKTIIRNIPNKRMPAKNSPSNVIGSKGATMTNEFIVIVKKI